MCLVVMHLHFIVIATDGYAWRINSLDPVQPPVGKSLRFETILVKRTANLYQFAVENLNTLSTTSNEAIAVSDGNCMLKIV